MFNILSFFFKYFEFEFNSFIVEEDVSLVWLIKEFSITSLIPTLFKLYFFYFSYLIYFY